MILKNKSLHEANTPQSKAGQKQEQDVAFFLRRAFKDHQQVLIINDFKFTFNDEVAQIDHLIIYTYGFILIESKSIKGHVQVNELGEWTRSHQNRWFGMSSPIKQVELQQTLLQALLHHHRCEILGVLLGIKQQSFRMRCWDHLCAVSSNAVINRDSMPKEISDKLVKTEFVIDKVKEIMNLKTKFMRVVNFTDTRPDFSQDELSSIADFLMNQEISAQTEKQQYSANKAFTPNLKQTTPSADDLSTEQTQQLETIKSFVLSCKHCGEESNYTPMYGKYGYYIKCNQCEKNTSMKQNCPQCQSKNTRIQKRGESYTVNCSDCSYGQQII